MPDDSAPPSTERQGRHDGRVALVAWAIAAIAVVGELARSANHDVAWFMYIAERMLEGERLYRDLLEANPPPAIWINFPAVLLGHLLPFNSLDIFRVGIVIAAGGSALATAALLAQSRLGRKVTPVVAALAALLLAITPGNSFGQREHLAAIALLPYLALVAATVDGASVSRRTRAAVGALAGAAVALKLPLLGLLVGAAAGAVILGLVRGRRWTLPAEHVAALATVLAAAAAVALFHPVYFRYAGFIAPHHYRFAYQSVPVILFASSVAFYLLMFTLVGWLVLRRAAPTGTAAGVFLLGSAAAMAAVIVQHKGLDYHFIAVLVLATMSLGLLVCVGPLASGGRGARLARAALTVGFAGGVLVGTTRDLSSKAGYLVAADLEGKRLRRVLEAEKPGASILVLSSQLFDAFPLVNDLGLRFLGGFPCQWQIQRYYGFSAEPGTRDSIYHAVPLMPTLERLAYERIVRDLVQRRPDLLLVERSAAVRRRAGTLWDFDFLTYLRADSAAARALSGYGEVMRFDALTLYRRER